MYPDPEQIALAAYFRWQRRGYRHGQHEDDWVAAERDLTFGLNYRWAVRHGLRAASADAPPVWLGKPAGAGPRRCRFCERSAPAVSFEGRHPAFPVVLGNDAVLSWDECDDCRARYDEHLAGAFEAFVGPLLGPSPDVRAAGPCVPVAALKALVRMGLAALPVGELDHFDDAVEWVSNPDDDRDAALLDGLGLGCHVYDTPEPVPAPFASLARRHDDDSPFPYLLFFLGSGRVVLQTRMPFCPRDEELDAEVSAGPGPILSLTMGQGGEARSSRVTFLPLASPEFAAPPVGSLQVVGSWPG